MDFRTEAFGRMLVRDILLVGCGITMILLLFVGGIAGLIWLLTG